MLYVEATDFEVLRVSEKHTCDLCNQRIAAWRGHTIDGEWLAMCGWCALYDLRSKWGYENRDEILYFGELTRSQAMRFVGANTRTPTLDEQHRLMPEDAEHAMQGVFRSSHLVRNKFRTIARMADPHDP